MEHIQLGTSPVVSTPSSFAASLFSFGLLTEEGAARAARWAMQKHNSSRGVPKMPTEFFPSPIRAPSGNAVQNDQKLTYWPPRRAQTSFPKLSSLRPFFQMSIRQVFFNLEIFVSIGKFPYFLPISYCLHGLANRPNFPNRKLSIESANFWD